MLDDLELPLQDNPAVKRSSRPRFRAAPTPLSFRWQDGKIVIEGTDVCIPLTNSTYVIGEESGPEEWSGTYYFNEDGRLTHEPTRRKLLQEACVWLFISDNRLRDGSTPPPSSNATEEEFEKFLASIGMRADLDVGLGTGADKHPGAQDATAHEVRREELWRGASMPPSELARPRASRSLVKVPPSDWKRALVSRLAIILDVDPANPLLQRMAEVLAREEGWYKWVEDPLLVDLYRSCSNPNKWHLILALEGIARGRSMRAGQQTRGREPFQIWFTSDYGVFVFALPRWPKAKRFKAATQGAAFVFAAWQEFNRLKRMDPTLLAVAAWKAGRFLTSPEDLCQRRPTLESVGRHFALTPPQIRYAARKLNPLVKEFEAGSRNP